MEKNRFNTNIYLKILAQVVAATSISHCGDHIFNTTSKKVNNKVIYTFCYLEYVHDVFPVILFAHFNRALVHL